jgi:hypothetical protein
LLIRRRFDQDGNKGSSQRGLNAGQRIEPLTGLVGSVPGRDHSVEVQYLCLEHPQLGAESGETRSRNLEQPFVACIGDRMEQFLDAIAPDRRDDPKLGKMGANRIDHRGPPADEQMACAVKHQATLLLGGLGLNEPHVGPGDRFADGLRVSRIVLLPFDVGLHVSRRHQPHGVAKRLEFA